MSDKHVRRSGDDYSVAMHALLPQGQAWPRDSESALGKTVRGLLVSETAQAVTLKPSDAPTVTIEKGQIASRRTEAMSIMPDDLIDKIGGDANIANVVAYLMGGR